MPRLRRWDAAEKQVPHTSKGGKDGPPGNTEAKAIEAGPSRSLGMTTKSKDAEEGYGQPAASPSTRRCAGRSRDESRWGANRLHNLAWRITLLAATRGDAP
jgi:hypothetical protein